MIKPFSRGTLIFYCFAFTILLPQNKAAMGKPEDDPARLPLLRVMSFNIRYHTAADKENALPLRKAMVTSLFRFHRADLIGVQEALRDQIDDIEKQAPEYAWCGVGRDDGKSGGEFSAIFYRKGRFDLLDQSTFWLSETPNVVASKGWDAALPRIVTWAKLRDKITKTTFFHFNTHFDHRGERARAESARLLVDQVAKIAGNLPVVVTGDFNGNESSEPYRILTGGAVQQVKLLDARYASAAAHHGPTSTFNGFGPLKPDAKIDFIFVRGNLKVLQHGVLADQWDGRWPSDHLPVLAELAVVKR